MVLLLFFNSNNTHFLSLFAAGDIREFLDLVTPDPASMAPVTVPTTSLTALRLMAAISPRNLEINSVSLI